MANDPEIECLKLKKAINENHRLAQKHAEDAIERAVLVGELLTKWKELLPHGKFEPFVDTHFEGNIRTAQRYMQAHKRLADCSKATRLSYLNGELDISGLIGGISGDSSREKSKPISAKGKPGGAKDAGSTTPPRSGPATDEAADSSGEDARKEAPGTKPQEQDPRPPRNGTDKPGVSHDYGTCPNCASKKWTADDFGVTCAKCHHPHGEPTGGTDEDRVDTQRSKTVKTAEALMRAFDDLNMLLAKTDEHVEAIASCKFLLKCAKGWK